MMSGREQKTTYGDIGCAIFGVLALGAVAAIFAYGMRKADREDEQRERRQEQRVQQALPGCTIQDLGQYKGVNHLIVVRCGKVSSANFMLRYSKWWRQNTVVEIEP